MSSMVHVPSPAELMRWFEIASASHIHPPEEDMARIEAAVAAGRPIFMVFSDSGFAERTMFWHELMLVPTLEALGITLIRNWGYDFSRFNSSVGEEYQRISVQLALLHRCAIACCDCVFAILDGEPPDNGTVHETSHSATLEVPVVGYRNDMRSSAGEAGNPYNLMSMAATHVESGMFVRSLAETVERLPTFISTLPTLGRPRQEELQRWMAARALFEQGGLFPVL